MSVLTLILQALAYDDASATSNPTQIRINRRPSVVNIPVDNPETESWPLDPSAVSTVIDGTRTLTLDGTTALSLALSSLDPSRYRITWTGGTNPGLRTDRGLTLNGVALTLASLPNLTLTVTAAGTPFAAVQVGDVVFIPGTSTGDTAGPFNPLNEGFWSVLAVGGSGANVTLARAAGTIFSGASEAVTPTGNSQLQAFASTGVQVGDTVDISAGFAAPAQHAYEIVTVTPKSIEFISTAPLANQVGALPGVAGLVIYTNAKRLVLIETDQEIAVRINGDTLNHLRLQPWIAGVPNLVAPFEIVGTVWKLVLVNLSSTVAHVVVASAE